MPQVGSTSAPCPYAPHLAPPQRSHHPYRPRKLAAAPFPKPLTTHSAAKTAIASCFRHVCSLLDPQARPIKACEPLPSLEAHQVDVLPAFDLQVKPRD